jgi:hypothetical protein
MKCAAARPGVMTGWIMWITILRIVTGIRMGQIKIQIVGVQIVAGRTAGGQTGRGQTRAQIADLGIGLLHARMAGVGRSP